MKVNKTYSGYDVWKYVSSIASRHHSIYDDPIHTQYKDQILDNEYVLKEIKIVDLLENDLDLRDFVNTQFLNYEWNKNKVENFGLIGNNSFAEDVLIDGYHRLIQYLINGEEVMPLFVPLGSRYYN